MNVSQDCQTTRMASFRSIYWRPGPGTGVHAARARGAGAGGTGAGRAVRGGSQAAGRGVRRAERVERVRVRFLTPTELKGGGGVPRPEFGVLFGRIRDRVSTLRALHRAGPLAIDFRGMGERAVRVRLVSSALRWTETTRWSGKIGHVHPFGGVTGGGGVRRGVGGVCTVLGGGAVDGGAADGLGEGGVGGVWANGFA